MPMCTVYYLLFACTCHISVFRLNVYIFRVLSTLCMYMSYHCISFKRVDLSYFCNSQTDLYFIIYSERDKRLKIEFKDFEELDKLNFDV